MHIGGLAVVVWCYMKLRIASTLALTALVSERDNAINDEKQSNYNIVYESSDTCYHKIKQNNAV